MRRSILWFCFIVTVLIVLLVWQKEKRPTEAFQQVTTEKNPALSTSTITSSPASASVGTNVSGVNTTVPPQNKGEQIKEGLAVLNDAPIAFYGRLEDQFGNSVVGAEIAASVRIYNGVQSTVDRFSVTSDENGFFTISHGKGESLSVVPSKKGYARAMTSTSYNYSYMYRDHFTPDPKNPTVIKMWKLQGAEPLVGINQQYKLHYTNAPINFDLVTGKIVLMGGDLKITINRPDGIISQQHPQNWSIQIEVVNGGVIETSDKEWGVTYFAPESGYQPNGTFGNDNGSDVTQRAFFIQSRNGQVYTKLGLSFRINDNPDDFMYVAFNGVANTNSSRNWEATVPQ